MNNSYTKEDFLSMKHGEKFSIPIDLKTTGKLWLIEMELGAMNIIFDSYIAKNGKVPIDNFSFDDFLGRYTGIAAQYVAAIAQGLNDSLGEEISSLLLCPINGFACFFESGSDVSRNVVSDESITNGNLLIVKTCPPLNTWKCNVNKAEFQ